MSNVYFCATDFYLQGGYGSYQDWFKLAELSGYPVIPLSQLDPDSDNTYIVTPLNDEWLQGWQNPRARIIHYELEYRWDWRKDVDEPPGIAEVWAGDRWYAGQIGARYVPLGSHPGLNEDTLHYPGYVYVDYDLAFMGYTAPPRRAKVLYEMYESGLTIAPNGWNRFRSEKLLDSKCMVAIHQLDNMPVLPPLRMCIAAAHKLAVISETVEDLGWFRGYVDCVPYNELARMTKLIVRNPHSRLKDRGEALYHLLCEHYTFRHAIERAL